MITEERSKDFMTGTFRGVSIVAKYMKECSDILDGLLRPSRRETYLHGQFVRALFWMLTLEKLNHPRDIQAIQSCTRSLLEVTIDMILLHHDKTDLTARKMLHWDRSQKLQMAEPMLAYYNKRKVPASDQNDEVLQFVKTMKKRIEKKRLKYWPNAKNQPRHPRRWSGDRSLLDDARDADKLHGAEIVSNIGMTLEELYESEYRLMNWYVHGSGLTGVLKLQPIVYYWISGLAYKTCSDLAMLSTKTILLDYGFAQHIPQLAEKWIELSLARGLAYLNQVKTPISEGQR